MADTEPMAHMMKGLVPRVAPLIYVITGAGPDQVVQCIITCSYEVKDYIIKCPLLCLYTVWLCLVSSKYTSRMWWKLSSPNPATWAPLPRELPGASMRSARLLNWPSARLKTRLDAKTVQKWEVIQSNLYRIFVIKCDMKFLFFSLFQSFKRIKSQHNCQTLWQKTQHNED